MFDSIISNRLVQQRTSGLLRKRLVADSVSATHIELSGKRYINFASNDYLGIATDNQLSSLCTSGNSDSANQSLADISTGSMASPLVVGRDKLHLELEQNLLEWVGAPTSHDCLLFSSGYSANVGVLSALFNQKNDNALLIQDKLNHASLMDVGRNLQSLGHVKHCRFHHNDLTSLDNIMAKHQALNGPKIVVTEGVFSMDGDEPDLSLLSSLARQNNAWTMLDDAHGIGVHGKKGAGSLSAQNVALSDCEILVITFGKAIGSQGAAVIANKQTIEYLTNFSREYIYSTHLSPLQVASVVNNIKHIQQDDWRREKLAENIAYFKQAIKQSSFELLASNTAIQPILIKDEQQAMDLSERLKQKGIWTSAMRYPTVAKKQARVRVTLSAAHSFEQIDQLTKQISS